MTGLILIIIIIVVALYFGWRMDRLERHLEDVHISLTKILALPLDLRPAELKAHLAAAQKQRAAGQRRGLIFLVVAAIVILIVALAGSSQQ
jgi:hypothetical protein